MMTTVNMPVYPGWLGQYAGPEELRASLADLGCDGLELIWGSEDPADDLAVPELPLGYHLVFWPDWVDFWNGDEEALLRKFGSPEKWESYYGGRDRSALLRRYREDLDRAERLGARYAVMHVSDVSIEEGYSYRWLHTDRQVVDAAVGLLDALTDRPRSFPILLENQWWPGLTLLEPRETARLLESVRGGRGLLLDTGHLMNCEPGLRTEADGVGYIHRVLDSLGPLAREIRGMHLHKSLSGEYVAAHTGSVPPLPEDYFERFSVNYSHILQIDRHEPWTDPAVCSVIRRIGPEFLTNELAASDRAGRERVLKIQMDTLRRGGLTAGEEVRHGS